MTGDIEQDYFVDGIVEEITTAISRLPWLFVIARSSSFTYKDRAVDVKQVAHELGVRYVLEGSVRKAGNRVRITGQLIDTATGAHIWVDRFDGALDDIFELQDQVASSVVGAIEPRLRQSEIERVARKPTESLDAYDLYLRAAAELRKLTMEGSCKAVQLLYRAIEIDGCYAPALAMVGWCRWIQRAHGWTVFSTSDLAESVQLAKLAIEVGKDDADALWMAGLGISVHAGEHVSAASAIDRSLVLNPNSAHAWMARGMLQWALNRPDSAIDMLQRAIRLSPLDPQGYIFSAFLAAALMLACRYEEAMVWADRSLGEQPRFTPALRVKAALCGHLGQIESGKIWVIRMLELTPGFTIAKFFTHTAKVVLPEVVANYVEGLRKVGVPDE
jgi:adenylate cyclase